MSTASDGDEESEEEEEEDEEEEEEEEEESEEEEDEDEEGLPHEDEDGGRGHRPGKGWRRGQRGGWMRRRSTDVFLDRPAAAAEDWSQSESSSEGASATMPPPKSRGRGGKARRTLSSAASIRASNRRRIRGRFAPNPHQGYEYEEAAPKHFRGGWRRQRAKRQLSEDENSTPSELDSKLAASKRRRTKEEEEEGSSEEKMPTPQARRGMRAKGFAREEPPTPPTTLYKACWRVGCEKADRTLLLTRPFLVHTCKTHALRVERRLMDMLVEGKIQLEEGRGAKDRVCGICGGLYGCATADHVHCSNKNCAFVFCRTCVEAMAKHATAELAYDVPPFEKLHAQEGRWVCWVCRSVEETGKARNRPIYLRTLSSGARRISTPPVEEYEEPLPPEGFVAPGNVHKAHPAGPAASAPPAARSASPTGRRLSSRQVKLKLKTADPSPAPGDSGLQPSKHADRRRRGVTPVEEEEETAIKTFCEALLEIVSIYSELPSLTLEQRQAIPRFFDVARRLAQLETLDEWLGPELRSAAAKLLQSKDAIKTAIDSPATAIPAAKDPFASSQNLRKILAKIINAARERISTAKTLSDDAAAELKLVSNELAAAKQELEGSMARLSAKSPAPPMGDQERSMLAEERQMVDALKTTKRRLAQAVDARLDLEERISDLKQTHEDQISKTRTRESAARRMLQSVKEEISMLQALRGFVTDFLDVQRAHLNEVVALNDMALQRRAGGGGGGVIGNTTTAPEVPIQGMIPRCKTIALFHRLTMNHHVPEGHLDQPARLEQVTSVIKTLWEKHVLDVFEEPSEADATIIGAVHAAPYIRELVETAPRLPSDPPRPLIFGGAMKQEGVAPDTFVSLESLKAATLAAGAVCEAVDRVSRAGGPWRTAFCAVRPPGHLVGRNGPAFGAASQGFGLLNNVAIGAAHAMFRVRFERIAIVDLDAVHGAGTEEILSGSQSFLFCTVHANEREAQIPPAENIVDVPVRRGATGAEWLDAINKRVVPSLDRFRPQLILLSMGFNGHADDPMQLMQLAPHDYFSATEAIVRVAEKHCSGRLVSVLEGGYQCTAALSECAHQHLLALIGDSVPQIGAAPVTPPLVIQPRTAITPSFPLPAGVRQSAAPSFPIPGSSVAPSSAAPAPASAPISASTPTASGFPGAWRGQVPVIATAGPAMPPPISPATAAALRMPSFSPSFSLPGAKPQPSPVVPAPPPSQQQEQQQQQQQPSNRGSLNFLLS